MDNKLSTKHSYTDESSTVPVTSIKGMLEASVSIENGTFCVELITIRET